MTEPTPNGLHQDHRQRSIPWHKHWNNMRHDLAVKQLNDRHFRRWIWCLEIAGNLGQNGYIPTTILRVERVTNADVSALIVSGLLDPEKDGVKITNWAKYQSTTTQRAATAERQRRSRESRT